MNNFNFSFDQPSFMMDGTNPSEMPSASDAPPQTNDAPADFTAASEVASLPRQDSHSKPATPVNTSGLSFALDQHQVAPRAAPTTLQRGPLQVSDQIRIPLTKRGIQCIRKYVRGIEIAVVGYRISYPWAKVHEWIAWRRGRLIRDHAREKQQPPAGLTPAEVESWAWNLEQRLRLDYLALGGTANDVADLQNGTTTKLFSLSEAEHKFWMDMAAPRAS